MLVSDLKFGTKNKNYKDHLTRLFIAVLWSPAGKVLTSWLAFAVINCFLDTFSCCILGQVWYLIVSIPDLFPFLFLFIVY